MKKQIGYLLKKILPYKIYKLLANGFLLVPAYYKGIIYDAEKYFDLSLENSPKKSLMLIRKYGHILDKGLHRVDAAPGHSKNIYNELKSLLLSIDGTEYENEKTVLWAKSKIKAYECLQNAPKEFKVLSGNKTKSDITFDSLFQLIKQRRSNRIFSDKFIDNNTVNRLIETVNWAANSCNKQPIDVYYTNDQSLAKDCLKCCKGGTGFSENIPLFLAFTANCRAYVWPSEMYLPTLDTSLGAQNLFLAAQTLGISGTILSWAQKDLNEEIKLRELLGIPEDQIIIFCAVMGYAESEFSTPERKL